MTKLADHSLTSTAPSDAPLQLTDSVDAESEILLMCRACLCSTPRSVGAPLQYARAIMSWMQGCDGLVRVIRTLLDDPTVASRLIPSAAANLAHFVNAVRNSDMKKRLSASKRAVGMNDMRDVACRLLEACGDGLEKNEDGVLDDASFARVALISQTCAILMRDERGPTQTPPLEAQASLLWHLLSKSVTWNPSCTRLVISNICPWAIVACHYALKLSVDAKDLQPIGSAIIDNHWLQVPVATILAKGDVFAGQLADGMSPLLGTDACNIRKSVVHILCSAKKRKRHAPRWNARETLEQTGGSKAPATPRVDKKEEMTAPRKPSKRTTAPLKRQRIGNALSSGPMRNNSKTSQFTHRLNASANINVHSDSEESETASLEAQMDDIEIFPTTPSSTRGAYAQESNDPTTPKALSFSPFDQFFVDDMSTGVGPNTRDVNPPTLSSIPAISLPRTFFAAPPQQNSLMGKPQRPIFKLRVVPKHLMRDISSNVSRRRMCSWLPGDTPFSKFSMPVNVRVHTERTPLRK